jgi:DnaJ-domain-containing protein 1
MMSNSSELIKNALEVLQLPNLITKDDIKKQYRYLSKKRHPDLGGDEHMQEQLNQAYQILMEYIDNFRFTFSEDEINRQFPGESYAKKFKQ